MVAPTEPGYPGAPLSLPLTSALFARQPARLQRLNELFTAAPHALPAGTASASLPLSEVADLVDGLPPQMLPPDIRHAVISRRLAFAAGRLCAEHALQTLQGRARAVGRGPMGEPLWPPGTEGSITHTATMAAAAVGRRSGRYGIGIDSELRVTDEVLPDIFNVCCTSAERQGLFGGTNDRLVATIVFSAKECLYKAIHGSVRRVVDFDEVEVAAIDWTRQQVRIGANRAKPGAAQIPSCVALFRLRGDEVHTSVAAVLG